MIQELSLSRLKDMRTKHFIFCVQHLFFLSGLIYNVIMNAKFTLHRITHYTEYVVQYCVD